MSNQSNLFLNDHSTNHHLIEQSQFMLEGGLQHGSIIAPNLETSLN